jgi:hypothetical protein
MRYSDAEPPGSLPRVAAYLAPLPAGAASHPECLAKAGLLRSALADRPLGREHVEALPAPVRQVIACPPLDGEWVPDVHLICVLLAIADAYGMTDAEYLAWLRDLNARMFQTVFKQLMNAPAEGLLRHVSERWSFFHRGSSLAVTHLSPGGATVHMAFPPRLFHGLALRHFVSVWEAALGVAKPGGHVELAASDEVTARFTVAWRG